MTKELPVWEPKRDYRFEYIWEAMAFLEEGQCTNCVFRSTHDPEYPICLDIGGDLTLENPRNEIRDIGDKGIVCVKFKQGDPTPPQVDGQEELF